MRIIGPPSASYGTVYANAAALGATSLFRGEMMPALWNEALRYNVDPVGVIAQAHKETAAGRYSGRVPPEFCNTCGLKVRDINKTLAIVGSTDVDHTLAHAQFPSWVMGARAHVEHLRAYAGWAIDTESVDPRYSLALKAPGAWCENFEELSGKWAPSSTYGAELVATARKLQVTA